jgi:hypothetical protein
MAFNWQTKLRIGLHWCQDQNQEAKNGASLQHLNQLFKFQLINYS